ncbi:SDR family NAD(P)-dependent oxidoreductase [Rhodoferax saidenbachensis]|uniref:Serine/threonine protein kinase n=1 Tax=Rhodoferax saidenbachensis TaxID=1484693 RepID=A0A1P8KAF4_9BURK|nr:SDR family oxidoreductase [Rhodoferax saidenbachensis]APW42971.1 serine/threonine protein kinase [Rhodoferax saidenbachensis]
MATTAFTGKVAVVTGAGSGIGRHLAIQLAQAGAQVALSDVNETGLAQTLALLPANAVARSYRVDVSKRDDVFAHAEAVQRDFGTAHFVFNNAGVSLAGTIEHSTIEEIEWQLGINLWGVIYGTKAFLPMLLAQREGHIVNISSVFGIVSFPGQGAYNVSKFGVRGWTECLWQELEGTGVRATSVHPGGIKTEIAHTARYSVNATEVERKITGMADQLLTTPPEDMARAILSGVARGKKRVVYGNGAWPLLFLQRWLPVSYGRVVKALERFA